MRVRRELCEALLYRPEDENVVAELQSLEVVKIQYKIVQYCL